MFMRLLNWYHGPVTLNRSYLFGAALVGLIAGVLIHSASDPDRVSWDELADLEPVPRESIIEPGTYSFGPYTCLGTCEGHLAGWRWAKKKKITNSSDCEGNSNSFVEGCLYLVGVVGFEPDAVN